MKRVEKISMDMNWLCFYDLNWSQNGGPLFYFIAHSFLGGNKKVDFIITIFLIVFFKCF